MSTEDEDVIKAALGIYSKDNIRNDSAGAGTFGAPRGTRKHKGTDFLASAGDAIPSPVTGRITKIGYPYGDDLFFRYVQIEDIQGNNHRMFYVDPNADIKVGGELSKGDTIGKLQDVATKHGSGMKNHVHYEILDSSGEPIEEVQEEQS